MDILFESGMSSNSDVSILLANEAVLNYIGPRTMKSIKSSVITNIACAMIGDLCIYDFTDRKVSCILNNSGYRILEFWPHYDIFILINTDNPEKFILIDHQGKILKINIDWQQPTSPYLRSDKTNVLFNDIHIANNIKYTKSVNGGETFKFEDTVYLRNLSTFAESRGTKADFIVNYDEIEKLKERLFVTDQENMSLEDIQRLYYNITGIEISQKELAWL